MLSLFAENNLSASFCNPFRISWPAGEVSLPPPRPQLIIINPSPFRSVIPGPCQSLNVCDPAGSRYVAGRLCSPRCVESRFNCCEHVYYANSWSQAQIKRRQCAYIFSTILYSTTINWENSTTWSHLRQGDLKQLSWSSRFGGMGLKPSPTQATEKTKQHVQKLDE